MECIIGKYNIKSYYNQPEYRDDSIDEDDNKIDQDNE